MKTDSFMNSLNKFIEKKMTQQMSNVGYGRSLYRDGDYDILIGSSDDAMVIEFKDEDLIKLAIGFVMDQTGSFAEPGIVLGSGNAYGDNRGFITKDTNSLNMYYIGDLSEDEVAGLAIYKDKVESTVPITVNAGLVDEFILDGTNWAAKLTEADAKAILEDPAKAWEIPAANLKATDVAYWNAGGAAAGAEAAAVSTIQAALNILSDLPSEVTMGDFGIKAAVDTTHYAQLTGNGLYIKNGAINIENESGSTMMSGDGIVAEHILAGTLTGFTIQTATSGARMFFDENGMGGYTSTGKKSGLWLEPAEQDYVDLVVYRGASNNTDYLFSLTDSGLANTNLSGWGNKWGELYADKFKAIGAWDFSAATVSGLSAVWG